MYVYYCLCILHKLCIYVDTIIQYVTTEDEDSMYVGYELGPWLSVKAPKSPSPSVMAFQCFKPCGKADLAISTYLSLCFDSV